MASSKSSSEAATTAKSDRAAAASKSTPETITNDNVTTTTTDNSTQPDWLLAKTGIYLLINNRQTEAEQLFLGHKDKLPVLAGYAFAVFMDALMTFEMDKFTSATNLLKEVERRCINEQDSLIKSVRRRMFGSNTTTSTNSATNSATPVQPPPPLTLAQSLETQIILADSLMCLAILTFLHHDISGYLKCSWLLRKSWKVYSKAYNEIYKLYCEIIGVSDESHDLMPLSHSEHSLQSNLSSSSLTAEEPQSSSLTSNGCEESVIRRSSSESNSLVHLTRSYTVNPLLFRLAHMFSPSDVRLKASKIDIDRETIQRLMHAVSFGYGLIQLGISLLPQALIKLSSFLGLNRSRVDAISCLMFARHGPDMRAPLATLSLLWHHTIVQPFLSLSCNVPTGVTVAKQILQEFDGQYGESPLFLFFNGRVHILNSEVESALTYFKMAVERSSQREVKVLAMYEMGWCYLIQLELGHAEEAFVRLKTMSRWSRCFYGYLANICGGANGKDPDLIETRTSIPKGSCLEGFLMLRCSRNPNTYMDPCPASLVTIYWRLLIYEMLYLWNNLSLCSTEHIANVKHDCEEVVQTQGYIEPMVGLARLLLGYCCVLQQRIVTAIANFRVCLQLREDFSDSCNVHVSAFAQYELGLLLLQSQNTREEGKRLLLEIPHFAPFDFQQRLSFRIHSKLKQL